MIIAESQGNPGFPLADSQPVVHLLVRHLAAELRTQVAHDAVRGETKEVTSESLVNQGVER
jgi:hypothetical protein